MSTIDDNHLRIHVEDLLASSNIVLRAQLEQARAWIAAVEKERDGEKARAAELERERDEARAQFAALQLAVEQASELPTQDQPK
jgi:hypothetical protein